jgi:hypothetical protein
MEAYRRLLANRVWATQTGDRRVVWPPKAVKDAHPLPLLFDGAEREPGDDVALSEERDEKHG